jgi:hypothetical protein
MELKLCVHAIRKRERIFATSGNRTPILGRPFHSIVTTVSELCKILIYKSELCDILLNNKLRCLEITMSSQNDAVKCLGCTALNGETIDKGWIGKDLEGSGRSIFEVLSEYMRGCTYKRKPREVSDRETDILKMSLDYHYANPLWLSAWVMITIFFISYFNWSVIF